MRIDRRWMGTRVRVVLNKTEAVQAAIASLTVTENAPCLTTRTAKIRIASSSITSDFEIDPGTFENHCRSIALRQIVVPVEASFRVGLDKDGYICAASWQFYEGTEGKPVC